MLHTYTCLLHHVTWKKTIDSLLNKIQCFVKAAEMNSDAFWGCVKIHQC